MIGKIWEILGLEIIRKKVVERMVEERERILGNVMIKLIGIGKLRVKIENKKEKGEKKMMKKMKDMIFWVFYMWNKNGN